MVTKTIPIYVLLAIILSACAAPTIEPTQTALPITSTLTPSPVPSETSTPTLTPEPTATATPEIPDFIKDIKVVNNPLKWRSAPEVGAMDMPALAYTLMERFNKGEFDALIPANFHYVPFYFSVSGFKYHGITRALNPLVGNPRDLYGMDKRWYFLSSMYKDNETGRTIAHYFIKQKDGSVGQYFVNIGINMERVNKRGSYGVIAYISGNDEVYTSPADFSEIEGCLELTTGDTAYCDYYMNNRDLILELYKEWTKTGFVPAEISNGNIVVPQQGQSVKKPY